MKIVDRFYLQEVPRKGVWFRYGKYSILNCGELNKTHPYPDGLFMGWEAMFNDEIIRADTWKELRSHLPKTSI